MNKLVGCLASLPLRDDDKGTLQISYASDCSGLDAPAVALKSLISKLAPTMKERVVGAGQRSVLLC